MTKKSRQNPPTGRQATFYGGHEISVLIWLVCFSKGLSSLDVKKKNQKINFCFKNLLR